MSRLLVIDFARGIAVICMIISHIGMFTGITFKNLEFNLNKFTLYGMNPVFTIIGIIAHTLFIVLVGVNMVSSYNKRLVSEKVSESESESATSAKKEARINFISRNLQRSAMIMVFGVIMSIITRILFKQWVVVFGIFQFIAISIVLAIPFAMVRANISLIGFLAVLALTSASQVYKFNNKIVGLDIRGLLNIMLGLNKNIFLDYFPLLPYFAYILGGVFIGKLIYTNRHIHAKLSKHNDTKNCSAKIVSKIGQNSIKIYFSHLIIIFFVMKICLRDVANVRIV